MPDAGFHLLYWPGIPGRGEYIRLALEEAGVPYKDTAHEEGGMELMQASLAGDDKNPPLLAPPALRHGNVLVNQTPNILQYLADAIPGDGLAPAAGDASSNPAARYHVHSLALTALDGLSNEAHDCHHPLGVGLYYEDQKAEALRRTENYVRERLPKFLGFFQSVLASPASSDGPWLYGGRLTYADLVLFQCVDGLHFMFPKAVAKAKGSGDYDGVFKLHAAVAERPNIKAYLASDRRQKYSMGLFRYYAELDLV